MQKAFLDYTVASIGAVASRGSCSTCDAISAHWMCFILVVVVHVLVQEGFCFEHFVAEAAPPFNTMVSVPSGVLYAVPAS